MTEDTMYLNEVKRWGIFQWEKENEYRRENAIGKLYKSKPAAEKRVAGLNEGKLAIRNDGEIRKTPDGMWIAIPHMGYVIRPVRLRARKAWLPIPVDREIKCACENECCGISLTVEKDNTICINGEYDYTNVTLPEYVSICEKQTVIVEESIEDWVPHLVQRYLDNKVIRINSLGFLRIIDISDNLWTMDLPDNVRFCHRRT